MLPKGTLHSAPDSELATTIRQQQSAWAMPAPLDGDDGPQPTWPCPPLPHQVDTAGPLKDLQTIRSF